MEEAHEEETSIAIEENVYSFFQFVVPVEQQKQKGKGKITLDMVMSYFLVLVCLFMQGLALYAIFNSVVVKDISWQNGVMTVGGKSWGLFAAAEACNDGSSLCRVINGEYSCAPPSVQLTSRWAELDMNKDGAWSYDEAVASRPRIKCKYAVDPVEVFDVFKKILLKREGLIWIHPDVKAGKKIFEPYFKYISGDVIMCGYATSDMCPNLLQRGFFNSALKSGTSPRVGNTSRTAMKYCRGLLDQGGTCEELLPSTYSVWKKEGVNQCGAPQFDKFVFKHPANGKIQSLLAVDYDARQTYAKFQTPRFIAYKSIIIFLWGLVMLHQLKNVVNQVKWLLHFPVGDPAPLEEGGNHLKITSVSKSHRFMNGIITVLRSIMLVLLMWIGTKFLLKSAGYVDLLFDAVAVVFVLEFAEVLYATTIRKQLQDEVAGCEPMTCPDHTTISVLRHTVNPGLQDMLWVAGLIIVVVLVMYKHQTNTVLPVFDALQCTCLQVGAACHEALVFSADFWNTYWLKTVPQIFTDVAALKQSTLQPSSVVFHVKSRAAIHHHPHVHRLLW